MDWDHLRFVLAVSRTGSALGAARALGVNQTTVMRRIAQVEAALCADLFVRSQSGYAATPFGQSVAETAGRMEAELRDLQNSMAADQRNLTRAVRLTSSETIANHIVAPCLVSFRKSHPGVRIEMVTDDRRLDVARGEADIALRAGSRPEGGGIVARRMPDLGWSVYCARSYADEFGAPCALEELRRHTLVGMEGPMAQLPAPRWLEAAAPDARVAMRSNSLTNLVSNLRAGLGVAALPCMVGDIDPDFVRCLPPPPELDSEMWLIVREELKASPAVRAFADFLAAYVQAKRAELLGRP